MKEEQLKLKQIVSQFNELIEENKLKQDVVKRNYSYDVDTMVTMLNKLESREKTLKTNIEKPYFARIDFVADDTGKKEVCYIGKIGTMDDDNNIVTVDWRTPIASLYYDSTTGSTSYLAPEGKITGNLLLKRQYEIEKRNLISFQDVDTVSNDELLKPYLSTSVDARLKNIVSTIQKEQNQIIREPLEKDIIVQGVAGSGKTTVALHRIAYLVYQNKDKIDISQYMILGPNKFFVNYISSVLPDLDATGVGEFDLLEFTCHYLGENIRLEKSNDSFLTKYKMSLKMKDILDKYIEELYLDAIPNNDLEMFGHSILSRKDILSFYEKAGEDTFFLNDRIERTIMFVSKYISERQEKLIISANNYIDELFQSETDTKKLVVLSNQREQLRDEIKNRCVHLLKKYFQVINNKTTSLYADFLRQIQKYDVDGVFSSIFDYRKVYYEDLVSLLYLRYRIYGNYDFSSYRQVVIDEAQDYGPFVFYIFKQLLPNATFSIFGDLAQTIYEYRTIEDWNNVISVGYQPNLCYLTKSYRTTIEIMEEANKINKHLNLSIAEAVVRHGKNVIYEKLEGSVKDKINDFLERGYQTIAIISKDANTSKKIYGELLKEGVDISLITEDSLEYCGGICSITSSLSKGLEFDAVIVYQVDGGVFDIDNSFDMKLLYVSMTRALHELVITYRKKLIPVLADENYGVSVTDVVNK